MSGVDPRVLLDAMSSMLGEYGDIKGPQEVVTIISLMKDAEKLLSRYTFLNILRATLELAPENSVSLETVQQYVKDGGCTILNKWLADAMGLENLPLILDVLEILEAMPVTIDVLKQGNIGKLVKQLTKREEKDIKELASSLLNKWMILVKGKPKKSKKSDDHNGESTNNASSPTMKRPRENSSSGKSSQPPEKKSKSLAEAKSSVTSVAKPPPKAKVIAPLPKPVVMESSGFMNALIQQSTTAPAVKKKKKVAPPPSPKQTYAGPLEEILQNQTQTHRQGDEKDKSSKEKEKNDEKEKEKQKEQEKEKEKDESPESNSEKSELLSKSATDETTALEGVNNNLCASENGDEASLNEVKTPDEQEKPSEPGRAEPMETDKADSEMKSNNKPDAPTKKKKSIKWAEDEKLVLYHYYEPDEEERVQHVINFHDAQHQEAIRERQRVEQAKRLSEDKMMEKLAWYRPRPLEVTELMERGEKSQEKILQKDRESKILAHLFFTKSSLPISPGEPEIEATTGSTSSQPLIIPHDEKGTIYPPSKGATLPPPSPEPSSSAESSVSLPPALAALLAGAAKGGGVSTADTSGSSNNQSLSNVDVQALLKKFMASQDQGEQNSADEPAEHVRHEPHAPRFPPLMRHQLRVPGRLPGDLGSRGIPLDPPRRGMPEFRSRGLLRTPGPEQRFQGPHGMPLRGRFPPPGGPRLRQPMPGIRIPGMGRAGMPNRFPGPDANRESGEDFYSDGDNPEGLGRGMAMRGRGARGRGRGRPTCRHFMSPRGCLRGNTCTFIHPGVNGPPV